MNCDCDNMQNFIINAMDSFFIYIRAKKENLYKAYKVKQDIYNNVEHRTKI